nr:hypothetical protein [Gammaproteobacteria bacterium]
MIIAVAFAGGLWEEDLCQYNNSSAAALQEGIAEANRALGSYALLPSRDKYVEAMSALLSLKREKKISSQRFDLYSAWIKLAHSKYVGGMSAIRLAKEARRQLASIGVDDQLGTSSLFSLGLFHLRAPRVTGARLSEVERISRTLRRTNISAYWALEAIQSLLMGDRERSLKQIKKSASGDMFCLGSISYISLLMVREQSGFVIEVLLEWRDTGGWHCAEERIFKSICSEGPRVPEQCISYVE